MTLTKQLYEAVREAIPQTTARTFSKACGMSEGYYGSITAQKLPISTNALICLAEVLECKKELLRDMTPRRLALIEDAQKLITNEIATRMQSFDCENLHVRAMIIKAAARATAPQQQYSYMPFLIA